ncbi:hypothetical protein AB0M39_17040 [Streptomyces sp. NPDC051907]|uniref:hypothetical protein n=1 Tax=Streptomyces sp. NPDC051907 TaxID=3155284 RepID=UPI00342BB938
MGGMRLRRRGAIVSAAVLAGLLVVGGSVAYGTGAYDDWQDARSFSSACDGIVDHTLAKDLLGAERLRGKGADGMDCSAFEPGDGKGSMSIRVQRGGQGGDSARLLWRLARANSHQGGEVMAPVGGGWPAVISIRGPLAYAGGYLPCGDGEGDDLIVRVVAHPGPSAPSLDDRAQRARLARVATGALAKAAGKEGCEAPDAKDVGQVPDDSFKSLTPEAKTTGTCRGTGSGGYESAADGAAPIEDCLLADAQGRKLFRLAAYYGPYVKSARRDTIRGKTFRGASGGSQGVYWTTAACKSGPALYAIETLYDGDRFAAAAPELELPALKAFAAQSAQRHGCGAVAPVGAR